jgi:hypothetical protein
MTRPLACLLGGDRPRPDRRRRGRERPRQTALLRSDMTATAVLAIAASTAAVLRYGRRSGATGAEVRARLAGDELVARPMWQSTRAITIPAPREDVWPWIVQMGFPTHRAGWYTPHWLDRLMWHITARSADRIVPELQHLAVGDRVPDSDDGSVFFTVAQIEPGRSLVLRSSRHLLPAYRSVDFTWAFVLEDAPAGTRLLIRARTTYEPAWRWPLTAAFVRLVLGPGDLVNASVMLRGIRRRASLAGHCGCGPRASSR